MKLREVEQEAHTYPRAHTKATDAGSEPCAKGIRRAEGVVGKVWGVQWPSSTRGLVRPGPKMGRRDVTGQQIGACALQLGLLSAADIYNCA